ncbi:MAG: diversity-generating retroelement protein Avd [Gammaproteobacteria bacterium]|nr:diversity-generating retroelement protein Avd [Gammaproteobacteria bacterium]
MKDNTPQAVENSHEFLLWLIPLLDQFPRNRRFTLGERLESGMLNVLELLVTAAYSREKGALLQEANRQLSVLRHLWRLCFELKIISMKRYEHGAKLINGIGGQIGNWIKNDKRRRGEQVETFD